jgi:hypothetical protein
MFVRMSGGEEPNKDEDVRAQSERLETLATGGAFRIPLPAGSQCARNAFLNGPLNVRNRAPIHWHSCVCARVAGVPSPRFLSANARNFP